MAELNQTWEELRASLHRYVRKKVNEEVAEDLVHDILLRVVQNEEKLIAAEYPIAWVYTVAKNGIADYYRKSANTSSADITIKDIGEVSGERLENMDNDFSKCLRPLTDRLEAKYKEALLLTDFAGRKQADVAKQLGVSVSGMKSRVQRARAKLKHELLDCCTIEVDRFGKVIDYQQKGGCTEKDCC